MKCNIRLPSIVKYHDYYAVMNLHFNPNLIVSLRVISLYH